MKKLIVLLFVACGAPCPVTPCELPPGGGNRCNCGARICTVCVQNVAVDLRPLVHTIDCATGEIIAPTCNGEP